MGQEFFINSDNLEAKVRQLLPSQGGRGAGFDLSASTQIVPIVDLTESAEGSQVRADLQTAFSLDNITTFNVQNTTTDVIVNTGFFRVFGNARQTAGGGTGLSGSITLTDGVTSKDLARYSTQTVNSILYPPYNTFDFTVFLKAGDIMQVTSSATGFIMYGSTRQIADIDGNLV